jgi:hypothetical protein
VSKFVNTAEGLALIKAFMKIKNSKVRHGLVVAVKAIAGDE